MQSKIFKNDKDFSLPLSLIHFFQKNNNQAHANRNKILGICGYFDVSLDRQTSRDTDTPSLICW